MSVTPGTFATAVSTLRGTDRSTTVSGLVLPAMARLTWSTVTTCCVAEVVQINRSSSAIPRGRAGNGHTAPGPGSRVAYGPGTTADGHISRGSLIARISDGVDNNGDGYGDNTAGWDFSSQDNDPFDSYHYGHGTGEARDSNAEANNGTGGGGSATGRRNMTHRGGAPVSVEVN